MQTIEEVLPNEKLKGFRGRYLETAHRLREQQSKPAQMSDEKKPADLDQLDFEFVLFASALIDYDYIMGLIVRLPGRIPRSRRCRASNSLASLRLTPSSWTTAR
jgi:type I restriction enzyme R subunit